jgi:hypothetical protein
MNYKLTQNEQTIFCIDQSLYIPTNEANTDYQAYLKWLSEGNTPLPAIEPVVEEPVVPEPLVDEPGI